MKVEEARALQKQFEEQSKRELDEFVSNSYPNVLQQIIQDAEGDIKLFANQGWTSMSYRIKHDFEYSPFILFLLKKFCKNKKEEGYVLTHLVEDLTNHLEKEGFKVKKCTYDEAETRLDLDISWSE